ncbi:hypothetical protein ABPG75_007201 [Micractinium tetrahymenae]
MLPRVAAAIRASQHLAGLHFKLESSIGGGVRDGGSGDALLPHALRRRFAVATHTASHRHALVKSVRGWRRGVRTLVLTNATGKALAMEQAEGAAYNERWVHYPDAPDFFTGKPSDPRVAVAPALAVDLLGAPFDWLLFVDDDVVMMWPGLLHVLQGLSPHDPYMISDSYWSRFGARWRHKMRQQGLPFEGLRNSEPPKPNQPRCLPCTFNDTGLDLRSTHAFKTCRCTVRRMAAAFKDLLTGDNQWQDFPRTPPISSLDGAGGVVFSAGLLRQLDAQRYRSCIAGGQPGFGAPTSCGGGDCLLTACTWQQGFGYTDPGFELRHRHLQQGMFLFNGARSDWRMANQWARDALVGACTGNCSHLWLGHMVSVHTGGADMQDYAAESASVARFLDVLARYAAAAEPSLEALALRLVS